MSLRSKKWKISRKKYILKRDKGICQICNKRINSAKEFSLDHIIPKSKGGSGARENLQLAHKKCNELKADNYG